MPRSQAQATAGGRVLVVEDDEQFGRMLIRLLESRGHSCLRVATTAEARAFVAGGRVRAVVLDLVLGSENGWETLRLLREVSGVPVLLITGAGVDDEVRGDAKEMGAQGILQKPFESDEFFAALTGALGY